MAAGGHTRSFESRRRGVLSTLERVSGHFRAGRTVPPRAITAREFASKLTSAGGERLPYTLAVHRGHGENPHAHLMISERANDGIERSREQWFRRYNAKAPEKGGAKEEPHNDVAGVGERHPRGVGAGGSRGADRSPQFGRAAGRGGAGRDLELAAQLSRKPNVHLGPQALRELPGEPDSFVHQKAERVEKENEAMAEERDGLIERIKERIAGIYQELQALPWEYKRELFSGPSFAELARKYSHAKGPQISTKPRSTQPTRGHERDVGPSR